MTDLAPHVVDMLVCPKCRAKVALDYERSQVVCTSGACGLAYPIRDGIPVMLIDEATKA